ncbi:MAG TPA: helix-turn-helix domain-containing protein, partial [Mucilaginibacter sp.]|nr:helix-turn-helix domain-containing protein [Mucilaginibacter sp.]
MNSYTFHISLYDIAFVGTAFTGLTLALQLWFAKNAGRSANRFLSLVLMVMTLWITQILLMDIRPKGYMAGSNYLPVQFLLSLGPLIYFYVRKITCPAYRFAWKDATHFIPALLEQVMPMSGVNANPAFYLALHLVIFASILIYLYRSHRLIQNFYHRLKPMLMDRPLLEFRWLERLLWATALLWTLWIGLVLIDEVQYHGELAIYIYYPCYIFFAVILIWTAVAALFRPPTATLQSSSAAKSSPLLELRAKAAFVKKEVASNHYYLDPELSLSVLAEKFGVTPHELSRIINTVFKKSFNDFINAYRVNEVLQKMQDPAYSHMNLVGIAYESGFNSKTTFNRAFKQVTGNNPVDYKKKLKKEAPFYNPGLPARFAPLISNHYTTLKWPEEKLNRNYMFKNYFKVAWRNVLHNKIYSALNIFGLAIGMAAALLIGLWAFNQYSYDRFLPNYQQAYAIKVNYTNTHDGTHTQ